MAREKSNSSKLPAFLKWIEADIKRQYLLIFLWAFILYSNTIPNQYSLDDGLVTWNNPRVNKGFAGIPEILTQRYVTLETERNTYGYRPVAQITFAVEQQFFGQNPHISHLINILLYVLCAIFLLKFLHYLKMGLHPLLLFLSVIFFMAHPVHTEVVSSLKNREELLGMLFGITSTLFALKYWDYRKLHYLLLSVVLIALAYLSKENAIVFIPIFILSIVFFRTMPDFLVLWYEKFTKHILISFILLFIGIILYNPFYGLTYSRNAAFILIIFGILILAFSIIKNKIPKYLLNKSIWLKLMLLLSMGLVVFLVQYIPQKVLPAANVEFLSYENPLYISNSIAYQTALSLLTLGFYLKLLLIPYPLGFYYGYNFFPITDWTNLWVWLSLGVHLFLIVFALKKLSSHKVIAFLILIYLISLLPVSNLLFPINGVAADRLLFIPSIAYCIAVPALIFGYNKRSPQLQSPFFNNVRLMLFSLIILIYTILTINRNKDWKNVRSIYEADIEYLSESVKANNNYAGYLQSEVAQKVALTKQITPDVRKDIDRIIRHYKKVLQYIPDYKFALNNLATVYFNYLNDYHTALEYFLKLEKSDTTYPLTPYNIGFCYERLKEPKKAESYYLKYLSKNKDYTIFMRLSNFYFDIGEIDKAIRINEEFSKYFPQLDTPFLNIAGYFQLQGKKDEAIIWLEKALAIKQTNRKAIEDARNYYFEKGNADKTRYYDSLLVKFGTK